MLICVAVNNARPVTAKSIRSENYRHWWTREGFVLTESVAILISLCEQHGEANLLPPVGAKPRAQALRWLLFVATELYPLVEINDYPERFTPAHSMSGGRPGRGCDPRHRKTAVARAVVDR